MARYLLLKNTRLHANGDGGATLHLRGAIVETAHCISHALYPIDGPARQAQATREQSLLPALLRQQRADVAHWLSALPTDARKLVADAAANRTGTSMKSIIEEPRYRLTSPAPAFVGCTIWEPESEMTHLGWPKEPVVPVNETAKKIAKFFERHRYSGALPPSPVDKRTNQLYLPAHVSAGPLGERFPATVPDDEATPEMPLYEYRGHSDQFGKRVVMRGDQLVFLAWPEDRFRGA